MMDVGPFLKYAPQMQTGDILGMRGFNSVSDTICKETGADISHVALLIRWEDAGKGPFLIQARKHPGVYMLPAHRELNNLKGIAAWYPLDHKTAHSLNPNYKRDIIQAASAQLGLHYDMSPLYRTHFGPLLAWAFPLVLDAWCCSFVVAHALKEAGLAPRVDLTQKQVVELPILMPRIALTPNSQWYSDY